MKSLTRLVLIFAFGLLGIIRMQAQVLFTVTATADADGEGYTVSHGSYTFIYAVGNFNTPANSAFFIGSNLWNENDNTDDALFTSLTGTGVAGTLVRPTVDPLSPASRIGVDASGAFYVWVLTDDSEPLGVTTPLGTPAYFHATAALPAIFAMPETFIDPVSYWSGYLGSYNTTGAMTVRDLGFNPIATFTVSNVTVSAIPEPATCAVMLGLGVFGLVALRRRDVRARAVGN